MRRALAWLLLGLLAASPASAQTAQNLLLNSANQGPSLNCNFLSGRTSAAIAGIITVGPNCPAITFTRASSATYFDATCTMQTVAANVARFDHDPVTCVPRGMQVEEQRTNLLLNSASLSTQTVTTTATATTLSFYGTGTVVLTGTYSGTLVGSGAYPTRSTLTFTPTAGPLVATVTGTVTDAQIEAGTSASSYIPTTISAATRASDLPNIPTGGWYSPRASTMVAGFTTLTSLQDSGNQIALELDDVTVNNAITLRSQNNSVNAQSIAFASGSNVGSVLSNNTFSLGVLSKSGLVYEGGKLLVALNGGSASSVSLSGFPMGIKELQFGTGYRSASLNGWLASAKYYPFAMTSAQLQQATR